MNILGIFGAIDWDSHKSHDEETGTHTAVHDSGATLFINGKLISSILEERLTRYKLEGLVIGNYIVSKSENKIKNIGYCDKILEGFIMDENDKLIAIKKPSGPGDIKSLGFKGTNNYTEMWENKEVYNTSIKFVKKSTLLYQ